LALGWGSALIRQARPTTRTSLQSEEKTNRGAGPVRAVRPRSGSNMRLDVGDAATGVGDLDLAPRSARPGASVTWPPAGSASGRSPPDGRCSAPACAHRRMTRPRIAGHLDPDIAGARLRSQRARPRQQGLDVHVAEVERHFRRRRSGPCRARRRMDRASWLAAARTAETWPRARSAGVAAALQKLGIPMMVVSGVRSS